MRVRSLTTLGFSTGCNFASIGYPKVVRDTKVNIKTMSKALATNVATVLVGFGLVIGLSFAFAAPAKAQSVSDLQAQINSLMAQLAALQGGASSSSCFTFTRNHKQSDSGGEVMEVQKFLNKFADTQVAVSGPGSVGNETSFFGGLTRAAVVKFQNKYAADILTPVGLSAGTGFWGPSSRAKANALCTVAPGPGPGPGPGPVTPPVTGSVTIMAGMQPANSLAPENAANVPFTNVTLTNNSSAAVTINSVTVERAGLAQDAVFSGLILLDGTMRIGSSKTLNSNHQATLDAAVTLQPGQSKMLTVAADMNSSLDSYAGQVGSLSVIGVNTTATVSGSLPIVGASHTMNSTLTIGTLAMAVGPSDPDTTSLATAGSGKSIGTTGFIAAEVRATGGSAEDVWVKSIRWNQGGSVSSGDLANVVTVVDGTNYSMVVSSDGKYYSATFPGNGIEITKGSTKDFTVKIDIVGGPNRTVRFDLYKAADLYVVGEVYGHGITPTQSESGTAGNGSEFTSGTPFFSGTVINVDTGTVTSISRASEVPAQNVAENTAGQPLGGFVVDVKGEGITVQQTIFNFGITGGNANAADITSVTLTDENGVVVAGPVDGDASPATDSKVTFTDTITFPVGRHIYTLKGKLGTDFANADTIQASTTPSTDWTTVKGATTGDTISLSTLSSAVTGNTMTVRAGSVAVSINSSPAAQNVVAGATGLLVAQYNFNATASGEDVKFTSAKFYWDEVTTLVGGAATNCNAFDGATRLTDTAVNRLITDSDEDVTFTFSTNLVVPKGATKIIGIRCDVPGSASSGAFAWDLNTSSGDTTFSGTGVASGSTITPTTPSSALTDGNTMTIQSGGALTVAKDSSSPSYTIAAGGTSNVTLGVLRFNGTNEDMRLDRVGLVMSNVAASSTPADLVQVTLWDGATQVGTATFSGSDRYATSTIASGSTVVIPSNGFKTLTVKGDLADIGTGQPGDSGVLIQVDYDQESSVSAGGCSTRAYGQSSGAQVCSTTTSDTAVSGVRMFRSYPTIAQLNSPSTTLVGGTNIELLRFSITASGNMGQADLGIQLSEITINAASSTGSSVSGTTTVENFDVYAFTDSGMSQGVPGFTNGLIYDGTDGVGPTGDNEFELSSVLDIPNGTTYYFKVVADVTLTAGTGTFSGFITAKLVGDSDYPSLSTLMSDEATIDALSAGDNFIWSPNSTTTESTSALARAKLDWASGYGVPGLPSTGTAGWTLSK
ncbi:MAG: hypothetical protein UY63_C0017G0017 [Parcubacteria group bacterium GW2011_GWA2_51_10]|nr:MAG: hypothetical protein UY63_C0017G0017 [Parcubacteria group bacterium GW2011_GWA2_51_10]